MANAWKRDKATRLLSPKLLFLLFSSTLIVFFFFAFLTSRPSNPATTLTAFNTRLSFNAISPFDCTASPQAHPVVANTVEGVRYPFLFSLSDFGTLPDKPHKNIVRMLKGKPFRKPDISVTVQEVLEKARTEGKDGFFVDVGANVGMASFAASAMRFRVLAFEPVFENLQKICEGVYFNRVADLVTVFEAAASDRVGNITVHKVTCLYHFFYLILICL